MTDKQLPKSHNDLINNLTKDLKPVKRVCPKKYFFIWFFSSLILATVATALVGYHGSLVAKFTNPLFILTLVVLFAGVILASWLAIKMSIPGEEPHKKLRIIIFFIPLALGAVVLWQWFTQNSLQQFMVSISSGGSCALSIILVSLLPLVFLSYLAYRLAPLNPFGTAVMISLAALLLSAIGGQIHCCDTDACHLAVWHYLPVFFACILIALPLQYFLSRWKKK